MFFGPLLWGKRMAEPIYSDKLIEITDNSILFRHYYFPVGSKQVNLESIARVEVKKPTLISGKYRIHGTGDFRTWFPCDYKRSTRDRIFIIHFKRGWWRIGFTAERSDEALHFFEERGLILSC